MSSGQVSGTIGTHTWSRWNWLIKKCQKSCFHIRLHVWVPMVPLTWPDNIVLRRNERISLWAFQNFFPIQKIFSVLGVRVRWSYQQDWRILGFSVIFKPKPSIWAVLDIDFRFSRILVEIQQVVTSRLPNQFQSLDPRWKAEVLIRPFPMSFDVWSQQQTAEASREKDRLTYIFEKSI